MEQADILVSVICCTYNHEPYIRQCLEGFIMQKTNFAFEVLVHDDASTDQTANIIREYEIKYPNIIKPIYQIENQYSKNVNIFDGYQISRATGKYIAICEGDDYWIDPLKLQKQVDFLEANPDYSISHTGYQMYYEKKRKFIPILLNNDVNVKAENVLKNYYIQTLTVIFRKELYHQLKREDFFLYSQGAFMMSDTQLWFGLLRKGAVHYLSDYTAVYYKHEGSATMQRNWKNKYRFTLSSFEMRKYIADNYPISNDINKWINNQYVKALYEYKCFDKKYVPKYKCINNKNKKIYILYYNCFLLSLKIKIVCMLKDLHWYLCEKIYK